MRVQLHPQEVGDVKELIMGMSKMALDRCRSLVITTKPNEERETYILEVFDPRQKGGTIPIRSHKAHSPHDLERIKRALMGQFRVPKEKVFYEEVKDDDKTDQ